MRRFAGFAILLYLSSHTAFATPPNIRYALSNGAENRRLLFSNNPEEIHADSTGCELADDIAVAGNTCRKSLLRLDHATGNFRSWWEHTNKTGKPISFGVRIVNRSEDIAYLAVQGSGFVRDGIAKGGMEFLSLFSNTGARPTEPIFPGEESWVFLAKDLEPRKYFAGAVNFSITGGEVSIENLAFFNTPAPDVMDAGYSRRVIGNVHESLVYKGLASASEASASNVDFTISDSIQPGPLPVSYHRFIQQSLEATGNNCYEDRFPLCGSDTGKFSDTPTVRTSWITHIGPDPADSNPKRQWAVYTDLVTLTMPGAGNGCIPLRDPNWYNCMPLSYQHKWFYPDFNEWRYPNWGNWAVHYKLSGRIQNTGARPRTLHVGIRADGLSPIAYRGQDGIWRQTVLNKPDSQNPGGYFPISIFTVGNSNAVDYSAEFVLSGPGAGTFEQFVRVID